MPTGNVEAGQENLCDVAGAIRDRLSEMHDRLDRVEGCQGADSKTPELSGLEAVLGVCRTEADRAFARLEGVVKRIGHL